MKEVLTPIGILVLVAVIWWSWSYPSGTWRYRMTVVVETPEGIKTGAAVREVHATCGPHLNPESSSTIEVEGEAVVVDLGKRGVLFALLRGGLRGEDYGEVIPFEAFPFEGGGTTPEGIRYYSHLKNAKGALRPEQYPRFVYFRDLKDIKTAEFLSTDSSKHSPDEYGEIEKTAEDVFGRGVKVKEVIIEMTDDPATSSIQKYLPPPDGKSHIISFDDFKRGM